MKKERIIVGALVLAMVAGAIIFRQGEKKDYEAQIRDLQVRLASVSEKPKVIYLHDSVPAYRTKVVKVDKTDYKKQLADKETIKELGLKVSQLESENRLLLNTQKKVELVDNNDSVLTYSDKWLSFSFHTDTRILDCEVRDSLSTYVSREYKRKFLCFKWGTKGYWVTVVSHNPDCKVEYNKFIQITK